MTRSEGDRRDGDGGDEVSSRRRFLNWILGTSAGAVAAAVLYPAFKYVVPPEVEEGSANSVTLEFGPDEIEPGSGRIFKFGSDPGILVRTPDGDLRAFTATCTHLSCIVQYREDVDHIWCACHNGHFDLHGENIQGPPPRPLERYDVTVRAGQIVVSRSA